MNHRILTSASLLVLAGASSAQWSFDERPDLLVLDLLEPNNAMPHLLYFEPGCQNVPAGDYVREADLAVGDLDQNGFADVVAAFKRVGYCAGGFPAMLLLGDGAKLYQSTRTKAPDFLNIPMDARDVTIADATGDGYPEVFFAATNGEPQRMFLNLGAGAGGQWLGLQHVPAGWFTTDLPMSPNDYGDELLSCAVSLADVDRDGDADLYYGNYKNANYSRLLINDGTGNFVDETIARVTAGNSGAFTVGLLLDMNQNDTWGSPEIVQIQPLSAPELLVNRNKGNFTASQAVTTLAGEPYSYGAGDLNGDGRIDLYVGGDDQDGATLNLSTKPNGKINISQVPVTGRRVMENFTLAGNIKLADVDNDGDDDVFVSSQDVFSFTGCGTTLTILETTQPGGSTALVDPFDLQPTPDFYIPGAWDVGLLDVDSDGCLDFVSVGCDGFQVWIGDNCP
ncbi:MAG: VCBS repeat-containing protein [Planctomycetota bacterium]